MPHGDLAGFSAQPTIYLPGNWRQTPWHKLVPFTPGNSSLSDTDLAANKEDLRKFQLEKVERENNMMYLNIIFFIPYP